MKWHLKNIFPILKEAAIDFDNHKSFRMSAALAYYTVFSIAPMLIVIISLCDFFMDVLPLKELFLRISRIL